MSGKQSNIREFWERCISETMFLRGHCLHRPSLYYTETGTLVLDARPWCTVDRDAVVGIYIIIQFIAEDFGYFLESSFVEEPLCIWKKKQDM